MNAFCYVALCYIVTWDIADSGAAMNAEYKLLATSVNFGTAIKLLFEAIRTTSVWCVDIDMNKSWLLAWLWKPTMRTLVCDIISMYLCLSKII